jgi:protein-S-isoprenylcysteine O-methyltransferase Ste14
MEQQEKLSFLGVGPRIAIWTIPTLAISLVLAYSLPQFFRIHILPYGMHVWIGWILLAIGIIFYVATVRTLISGLKQNKLITTGTFRLCQNPLYAALILFIIPAVSFLTASWLVFLSSVVAYLAFKKYIQSEYDQLSRIFGEEYNEYRKKTRELLPLPK